MCFDHVQGFAGFSLQLKTALKDTRYLVDLSVRDYRFVFICAKKENSHLRKQSKKMTDQNQCLPSLFPPTWRVGVYKLRRLQTRRKRVFAIVKFTSLPKLWFYPAWNWAPFLFADLEALWPIWSPLCSIIGTRNPFSSLDSAVWISVDCFPDLCLFWTTFQVGLHVFKKQKKTKKKQKNKKTKTKKEKQERQTNQIMPRRILQNILRCSHLPRQNLPKKEETDKIHRCTKVVYFQFAEVPEFTIERMEPTYGPKSGGMFCPISQVFLWKVTVFGVGRNGASVAILSHFRYPDDNCWREPTTARSVWYFHRKPGVSAA